jgi:hypothetical protein
MGRQLNPCSGSAGIRYEYSHLTVSGDAEADRKLRFWKPTATIDWKPGHGWHTQFSIKRTVAQLNFFDFVTAAELSTDRVNAGNADLQPQRAWEFRATADHPLLGDGRSSSISARPYQPAQVLICDDVDTTLCFDAPGNIGTGKRSSRRYRRCATSEDQAGTRLKFFGQLQRTSRTHLGRARNFSASSPVAVGSLLRRKGAFSYGALPSPTATVSPFSARMSSTRTSTHPRDCVHRISPGPADFHHP